MAAPNLPPINPSCSICHNLDKAELSKEVNIELYGNKEFEFSAESECLACKIIRDGIVSFLRSTEYFPTVILRLNNSWESVPNRSGTVLTVDIRRTKWDEWKPDDVRPRWDNNTGGGLGLEFYTPPGKPSIWEVIPECPEPAHDSTSDLAMTRAREWLNTCTKRHKTCSQTDTDMPTRVIFVGDDNNPPRLVTTNGKRGQYVALTWSWGSEPALVTTKVSIYDHEIEIPWSHLPPLFIDAALVTRKLGIDYLWIDALCIIQDSDDDWRKEASKMTQVYGNAHLTIAADACCNAFHSLSGTGAFRNLFVSKAYLRGDGQLRNLLRSKFKFPCPGVNGDMTTIGVRLSPEADSSGCHAGMFAPKSVLKSRGWCLQEHLLSRRLLHFGAAEMSWQCMEMHSCECHQDPIPSDSDSMTIDVADTRKAFLDSNTKSSLQTWLSVVEEFTSRSLSHPKDRLPALEGLANLMATSGHTSKAGASIKPLRLAGMWQSTIEQELAWYVKPPCGKWRPRGVFKESIRTSSSCTWSWASVTGAVRFVSEVRFDIIFASEPESNTSDRDLMMNPSYLHVRGKLWRRIHLIQAGKMNQTMLSLLWVQNCPMYEAGTHHFPRDDPRRLTNDIWHPVILDVWNDKVAIGDVYSALEPSGGAGWALLLKEAPEDSPGPTNYAKFQRVGVICHNEIMRSMGIGMVKTDRRFKGPDIKEETVILV